MTTKTRTGYPVIDEILESIAPGHEQPASAPVRELDYEQAQRIEQLLDTVAYAEDVDKRVDARIQITKTWNQHQQCATQLQFLANRAEELSSLLAGMTTERDRLREVLRQAREQIEFLEQALEEYHGSRERNSVLDVIDAALNHAEQGEGS